MQDCHPVQVEIRLELVMTLIEDGVSGCSILCHQDLMRAPDLFEETSIRWESLVHSRCLSSHSWIFACSGRLRPVWSIVDATHFLPHSICRLSVALVRRKLSDWLGRGMIIESCCHHLRDFKHPICRIRHWHGHCTCLRLPSNLISISSLLMPYK